MALAQRGHDVEVLEAKARRVEEGRLSIDGRVRAGKPLKGLTLTFDFLTSDGELLSSQKTAVEDDVGQSRRRVVISRRNRQSPGSVRFKIRAFDGRRPPAAGGQRRAVRDRLNTPARLSEPA
jgi:hypothetical protein